MANLKEIRIRIASVQSTQKITGAMKMVSAAKLRRAQTAIINLRPYSNKLNEILKNLSSSADEMENMPLFQQRKEENIAIVAISSNRGLCGSFNTNVFKKVEHILQTQYAQQVANGNVKLYCIGKKAKEQLIKNHEITWHNETLLDTSAFDEIADLGEQLMLDFINKKIDSVRIVYNKFINPATQELVSEDFLPIQNIKNESENTQTNDYIFEPSKDTILCELIPKILKLQLYKTLLDSIASEHGARMTAMHKATDNATEILKELKLKYNNARQSSITNELIEIVSGAEALNN
ncbi:MAG TPA: ATP synthase F1 subunit gamma [Bacteroidales bacterium]|nr:ATP synthase F1 subunit gamma [Bacteroidales bacterium]HPT52935.1 ATP synthase F1 subunit gamma [Bacteroidales bacterium]